MSGNDFPIDAVISWVDGNDPAHRALRARYSTSGETSHALEGGDQRFVQFGEIRFCVASILSFAPWIRTVWIVTAGQDPQLGEMLETYFPSRASDVKIVDHSVIFRGYEEYLPVFGCRSIECLFWRIPGISEHFIYFNDDEALCRPCARDDFFDEGGRGYCYAHPFSVPFTKFLRWYKTRKYSRRIPSFKDGMLTSAEVVGEKWSFPYLGHIPAPLRCSVVRDFFEANPDVLRRNLSYRFRSPEQFNPQVLNYILGLRSGAYVMRSRKGVDMFLSHRVKPGYIERKLSKADSSPEVRFCCFNSMEKLPEEDRQRVSDWISSKIFR